MLRSLLGKLERDKAGAGIGDGDREYCRSFAETVFARADRADRAGKANKGTALTFLAASFFIDVRQTNTAAAFHTAGARVAADGITD